MTEFQVAIVDKNFMSESKLGTLSSLLPLGSKLGHREALDEGHHHHRDSFWKHTPGFLLTGSGAGPSRSTPRSLEAFAHSEVCEVRNRSKSPSSWKHSL